MKSIKSLLLFAICLVLLLQACQIPGLTADDAQHETSFDQPAVFIDADRIELIKERIQNQSEPVYSAFRELMSQEEELLEHESHVPDTWYVPPFYQDAEGHRLNKGFLMDDANVSYKLALLYRLTDNGKYAEKSASLIDAWSGLEELEKHDDSSLSFSYHFPSMIFAAGLLRGSEYWTENHENRFSDFVRERALPMNTMHRENNWGNWGLVLVLASSVYLDDSQLFEEGVERWKYFIEEQIAEDGHLPHEVTRNNGIGERGIWYTHFTLMPQTVAAEIAKVNGTDLYDYQSPSGRTFEQAFRRVAPWALNPEEFPYFKPDDEEEIQRGTGYISYFEILNDRWPDDAAAEMLKQQRPADAPHSAPLLTLTHGEPLELDSQSEIPVGIIFDTDMTTDCDDAGALAMLHTLERKGEAQILATIVNNRGEHSAGATAAINAFYNRPDIPVGAYQGDVVGRDAADFFSDIALDKDAYGHEAASRDQFPDAVEVYRRALSEAGPNEVVIVSVGHLNNLYDLLESGADEYSSLNGMQLVEQKVDHLVVMGGHFLSEPSERYPYGSEHNFRARGSAQFTGPVLDRWPTRVLLSGYEIGENIRTGPRLTELDKEHPVRRAYAGHPSEPLINGRMSWDQTAILAAVRDPELYWRLSEPGRVEVDSEGHNSWISDPEGLHVYLIERDNPPPSEIAEIIEELMVDMP